MSFYQKIATLDSKLISRAALLKHGFNFSPMYRRSTARLVEVSNDILYVKIKLPISWKNKNYVNTIFGGSMFSAVDPIPMVQLINLLGEEYVVWDKAAKIVFKRPAKEDLYAEFSYSQKELEQIKKEVKNKNEIEIIKRTKLTGQENLTVYCEVEKTIYIADKTYFKQKRKKAKNLPPKEVEV